MYLILFMSGSNAVHAAVFFHKLDQQLSSQVTHRGDPFSAFPDPIPQPLCLVGMCLSCLVLYPIILCPCSKNPGSAIVLLTCSTLPTVSNTPCCLPSSLANLSHLIPLFIPLVCSTSMSTFIPSLHSIILFLMH